MDDFYVLLSDEGLLFGNKWAYAEMLAPANLGDSEKCPYCGATVSDRKWLPPHRVKLSSDDPKKWGDLLWGAGFPLLVSSRFKEVYDAESLKGIEKFHPPVQVVKFRTGALGESAPSLPAYHLIEIPWGGANQDDEASGVEYEHPGQLKCSYCRQGVTWRKQKRVAIAVESWDGADIFVPRGAPVQFMVTGRFRKTIEQFRLTNCWFIPAESFIYDERRPGLWYLRR